MDAVARLPVKLGLREGRRQFLLRVGVPSDHGVVRQRQVLPADLSRRRAAATVRRDRSVMAPLLML